MNRNETENIDAPYELPEGWKWVNVGSIAEVINGKNQKEVEDENGLYPIYGSGGIIGRAKDFICPENCTIIGRKGTINNPIFVETKFWNVDTAFGMKPFNSVNPKFYFYFCKNFNFSTLDSSTAIPSLTKSNIQKISFPLPPTLSEQQRIVSRIETMFAKLDEAKEKAQNVVDSFETRKAAILHQAFTGNLTAHWREENGVSDDSWEEITLEQVTSKIGDGLHGTPIYSNDGKYAFINGNNFFYDHIEIKIDTKFVDENEFKKYSSALNNEIVFVSINGTLGRTAFYNNEKVILGKSACYINVISSRLDKYFLRWLFESKYFIDYANEKATGSTIKNLGLKAIRNLPISLPVLSEQQEIVRILDAVLEKERSAKSAAEQVLEQIDLLKKSILARAFRGEF